jgi:hypothetical protein
VNSVRFDARVWLCAVAFLALLGCGSKSDPTSPGAALDSTAPPAPAGLALQSEGYTMHLIWDASAAPDVTKYQVYEYSPDPSRDNAYVMLGECSAADTYYPLSAVGAETHTFYRVRAVDGAGNRSAFSGALEATLRPDGPTGGSRDVGDLNPRRP